MAPFTFNAEELNTRKEVLQQLCDDSDPFQADEVGCNHLPVMFTDRSLPFPSQHSLYLLDGTKDHDNKVLIVVWPPREGKSQQQLGFTQGCTWYFMLAILHRAQRYDKS